MNVLMSRILLGSTILSLGISGQHVMAAELASQELSEDKIVDQLIVEAEEQSSSLEMLSEIPQSGTSDLSPLSEGPAINLEPSILLADSPQSEAFKSINPISDADYHLKPLMPSASKADMGQVTSVSQLSDVQPTDWAFQAVQSLVERYGCIAGYPDGTFRGNQFATRYELAAALNACLDNIGDKFATKEDLEAVRALQEEFQAELATLRGRVDGLEARTATLEAQQFSTTTKLNGEVIFALSGFLDGVGGADPESRARFNGRARLNFLTSFSGKDLLYTRLQASNLGVNFDGQTGTPMTRLSFDTGNTNNTFILDRLSYKFPVGDKLKITAFANNGFHHYYATTINPYYEGGGGGKGALSFFGERNPIYRNGTVVAGNGIGIGTQYDFSDKLRLDIGYLAAKATNATALVNANGEDDGGLVGGTYSLLGQLSYKPFEGGQIGLTYLRNNAPDGNIRSGVGSPNAQIPFLVGGVPQAFSADSFGLEGTFKIGKSFAIGGWAGYTRAYQQASTNDAEIINAAVNLTVFDLIKEGSQLGFIVGLPPKNFNNDIAANEDNGTSIHLEGLYQFPINDNIKITPGVIYIINPNHNNANPDVFAGVLRTTFSF